MRLILITPGFSADRNDDCIPALRTLVRGLARRHQVTVLALRYPGRARDYPLDGAQVTALGGGGALGWRRWTLLGRAWRWLRGRAASGEVDLVHGLWADEPGFLATSLERRYGVPALVSLLGGELARLPEVGYGHQLYRAPRWLVARSLRRAHLLTVGSPWLLERLAANRRPSGRHRAPARLAPLGVDTDRFRPEGGERKPDLLAPGAPAILSVGSLTPVKGHADLLAAFARASAALPRATLHLVGEGPLRAALETRATELGVGARVRFHGPRAQELLPDLYRSADFCALASRWESQSMVALEAAASGRVTVGSAVGLLPELAPQEGLAAPGDVDGLARALARAGAATETWVRWGERARALAVPRYAVEETVAGFEAAYAELSDRGRHRR